MEAVQKVKRGDLNRSSLSYTETPRPLLFQPIENCAGVRTREENDEHRVMESSASFATMVLQSSSLTLFSLLFSVPTVRYTLSPPLIQSNLVWFSLPLWVRTREWVSCVDGAEAHLLSYRQSVHSFFFLSVLSSFSHAFSHSLFTLFWIPTPIPTLFLFLTLNWDSHIRPHSVYCS